MRYAADLVLLRDTDKNQWKVVPPPPSKLNVCNDPVAAVQEAQMAVLDPTGERKALFDYRRSARSVKPGDIIRVTFKSGDPFAGVVLSIRSRGIDTSVLLRNQLTRVGVEMWIKVFSPNVEGVEIVQRAEKRKRRARIYYMRYVYFTVSGNCTSRTNLICLGNPSTTLARSKASSTTTCARSPPWLVARHKAVLYYLFLLSAQYLYNTIHRRLRMSRFIMLYAWHIIVDVGVSPSTLAFVLCSFVVKNGLMESRHCHVRLLDGRM